MAGTATATPPAPAAAPAGKGAAMPARPFRVGVQEVDDTPYDQSLTATAGTQDFPTYELPSTGFLNKLFIWVTNIVLANAATTVNFANVGPFNGWVLKIVEKWGGYSFSDDPQGDAMFTVFTGAAGTYTVLFKDTVST